MRTDRVLAAVLLAGIGIPAFAGGEGVRFAPSDASLDDLFGTAISLAGTTALVGAPGDDDQGNMSGSAYLFDTVTARQLAKLLPLDGTEHDQFGYAVALRGTTAVVGAPYAGTGGAVYVFDADSGQQLAKLVAADGQQGGAFGFATALYGTTLLVGAPDDDEHGEFSGSCYVFDLDSGQQLAKLFPEDGSASDEFGGSVAIYGSRALIGAARDVVMGLNTGSAYVFDTSTGQELAKLVPSDATDMGVWGGQFGFAVALHGTTALVGARWSGDSNTNQGQTGAAYLFEATTGVELSKLTANDAFTDDRFGSSVALTEDVALIGAVGDNEQNPDAGAAYLFDPATGQQIAKLLASDGAYNDLFGGAVAISGSTAVVGAPWGHFVPPGGGAAYVFAADSAIAVPYCFGTGAGTPCPCSNEGLQGHGCANSAAPEGARLFADGSPCVEDDDLVLRVWNSVPQQPGLFFQGDDALNGGLGDPFGDGLRCAGTHVLRLEIDVANADGRSSTTIPLAQTAGLTAGDVKRYQWWYRDPVASPCGTGFNLSNGLEVTWGP